MRISTRADWPSREISLEAGSAIQVPMRSFVGGGCMRECVGVFSLDEPRRLLRIEKIGLPSIPTQRKTEDGVSSGFRFGEG